MTKKFNVAVLAVLAATLCAVPMIASAHISTASDSTVASPSASAYHGVRHRHRHHRHRRPHMGVTSGL